MSWATFVWRPFGLFKVKHGSSFSEISPHPAGWSVVLWGLFWQWPLFASLLHSASDLFHPPEYHNLPEEKYKLVEKQVVHYCRSYSCSAALRQTKNLGSCMKGFLYFITWLRTFTVHLMHLPKNSKKEKTTNNQQLMRHLQGRSWFYRGYQQRWQPPPPPGRWRRRGRSECYFGWCRWTARYPEEPHRYELAEISASPTERQWKYG